VEILSPERSKQFHRESCETPAPTCSQVGIYTIYTTRRRRRVVSTAYLGQHGATLRANRGLLFRLERGTRYYSAADNFHRSCGRYALPGVFRAVFPTARHSGETPLVSRMRGKRRDLSNRESRSRSTRSGERAHLPARGFPRAAAYFRALSLARAVVNGW